MSRKELRFSDITIAIDSREQLPYSFPTKMVTTTLATADYSVAGLESSIAVERKSRDDLLMCVGNERERFEREMMRLAAYESRALVVECSWADIEAGGWRSKVTPQAAMGSLIGWAARGIPVIMLASREAAQDWVARFLFIAARRRWRELLAFHDSLKIAPEVPA